MILIFKYLASGSWLFNHADTEYIFYMNNYGRLETCRMRLQAVDYFIFVIKIFNVQNKL